MALCCRYDALGEDQDGKLGTDSKIFMEKRCKLLEAGGTVIKAGGKGPKKYEPKSDSKGYNESNDFAEGNGYKRQKVWVVKTQIIYLYIILN